MGAVEISVEECSDEAMRFSRLLYAMLVHTCEGRALSLVKGVRESHGLEAWRRMCEWYQPRSGARGLGLLTDILNWDFGTKDEFPQKLTEWDNAVLEYARTSGEAIQESILIAILMGRTPKELNIYLGAQITTTTKLSAVRRIVLDFVRSSKQWSREEKSDYVAQGAPMDMSAFEEMYAFW